MIKEKAKEFFCNNFPEYKEKIERFERIEWGFSNHTFKVELSNGKSFKVRIANNNQLISRKNELEVLKLVPDPNLLVYDTSTGNAIYSWIEGEQLTNELLSDEVLHRVVSLASLYHCVPVEKLREIPPHDHFDSFAKVEKGDLNFSSYSTKYRDLVRKYEYLPKVLTHNDISLKNLIYSKKSSGEECISLIDYEWARVNTIYWEYGNFARESQLSREKIIHLAELVKLDKTILLDFVFISTFYAWQLSFNWTNTERLQKYRSQLVSQMKEYEIWKTQEERQN